MNLIKTCPVCQEEFTGRSNKMYCSNTCKLKAFKEKEVFESESGPLKPEKIKEDNKAKNENLKLQIELKKLEYKHEQEMYRLQDTEQPDEIFSVLQQLINMQQTHSERIFFQLKNLNQISEEILKNTLRKSLPDPIIIHFEELSDYFISNRNEEWEKDELQDFLNKIESLIRKITRWSKRNDVKISEFKQINMLNDIKKIIEEGLKKLQGGSLFSGTTIKLKVNERWFRSLKEFLDS